MTEGVPDFILKTPDGSEFLIQRSELTPSGSVRIELKLTLEMFFDERTEVFNKMVVHQVRLMSQF
jgi:hypothetical protein